MTPPKPLADAHTLITTTDQPIADIAAGFGLSVDALDKRLARAYGKRARELRTGEAKRGRSPTGRETWRVRLTPEERARVEELLEAGRAAGATTDGEALIKGLDLLDRAALLAAVDSYRAAAASTLRTYSGKERFNVGEALHHPKFGRGTVTAAEGARMTVDFGGSLRRLMCTKARQEPKTPVRRLDLPRRLRHDPTRPSAVPLEPPSKPEPPRAVATSAPKAPRPAALVKPEPPLAVAPVEVLPPLPAWAWAEARGCAGVATDADFDLINSRGGYTGPGVGPEFGMVQEASRRLAEERAAAQEPAAPPPPEEIKPPAAATPPAPQTVGSRAQALTQASRASVPKARLDCRVLVRGKDGVFLVVDDPSEQRLERAGKPHRNGLEILAVKFDFTAAGYGQTMDQLTKLGAPREGWPVDETGSTSMRRLAQHIMAVTKGKKFPLTEEASRTLTPRLTEDDDEDD